MTDDANDDRGEPRVCGRCGRTADAPQGGLPDGWSLATERGRVTYECGECVRANIRAIEGKLSSDWWEH